MYTKYEHIVWKSINFTIKFPKNSSESISHRLTCYIQYKIENAQL